MQAVKNGTRKILVLVLCLLMASLAFAGPGTRSVYAADAAKGTTIAQEGTTLTITRQGLEDPDETATDWTIMIYMCGSDLESGDGSATANINEMLAFFKSYTDSGIKVILQTGGAKAWKTSGISTTTMQRYQVVNEDSQAKLKLIEDVSGDNNNNIGLASSLQAFIEWGLTNYQSTKIGLIFWDHGNGTINGLCNDEINDSHLSITDLDAALLGAKNSGKLTQKFEFIGFDTCLMGNIETANQIAPYTHFMIGSEELEAGGGWNYTKLLTNIQQNTAITGGALGKTIVDDFYAKCEADGDCQQTTLSSLNLDKLDALLQSLNTAFNNIRTAKTVQEIAKVAYKANNFGGNTSGNYVNMVDIGNILQGFTDVDGVNDALTLLANGDDNFVVYNKNGASHTGAMGISTYYPLSIQQTSDWQYFASVCPIPQYFNMTDQIVTALSGKSIAEYVPAVGNTSDSSATAKSYCAQYEGSNLTNNADDFIFLEKGVLGAKSIYFNEDGFYTIEFEDISQVVDAQGVVYQEGEEADIYLGTVDNVYYEGNTVQDDFDGYWPQINGLLLPLDLTDQNEVVSTYLVPVQITNASGKNLSTNLVVTYNYDEDVYRIVSTWDGVDDENSYKTSRTTSLQDESGLQYGDTVAIVYDYVTEEDAEEVVSDKTFIYDQNTEITYEKLPAGDYDYGFVISDALGNCYYSEEAALYVDEQGEVEIYTDEEFEFNGDAASSKETMNASEESPAASEETSVTASESASSEGTTSASSGNSILTIILICLGVAILAALGLLLYSKGRKK